MSAVIRVALTALLVPLLLAACTAPDRRAAPPFAAFACGDTRLEARPWKGRLLVSIGDSEALLDQVGAGSGVRYQGGRAAAPIDFWERGGEATLKVGAVTYPTCRRLRDTGAAQYRAQGSEPSWSLALSGGRLVLDEPGRPRLEAPLPPREEIGPARVIETQSAAGPLRVDIDGRGCRDAMSGQPYPDAVAVMLPDGRRLAGCGGSPATLLQGGEWRVIEIGGAALAGSDGAVPTLLFGTDGQLTGSTACNRYGAPYAVTGEGITLGPARMTRRACLGPAAQTETRFVEVLRGLSRFDLRDDGALVLNGTGGRSLVARR